MIPIKTYTPARRSITAIFLVALLILVIGTGMLMALALLVKKTSIVLLLLFYAAAALTLIFGVPRYFKYTKLTVSAEEICYRSGFLSDNREYMPTDSVKSVTSIVTPLSSFTGLNFLMINALGAKIIVPFMRRSDCLDAVNSINELIKARNKGAPQKEREI